MSYNKGNSSKNVTGASVVDGTLENADFADNGLSGDKIDGGTISNFTSTGIDDNATSTAITIDASERVNMSTGSSGATAHVAADELVVEGSGSAGISILTPNTSSCSIRFGDPEDGDAGKIIYDHTTNGMGFSTSGTERVSVTDNGLTFNGDTAAANALDDYEEGTWDATVQTGSGSGTKEGRYTKIGRMVYIDLHNMGSEMSGNCSAIGGLPFATGTGPTNGAFAGVITGDVYVPTSVQGVNIRAEGSVIHIEKDAAAYTIDLGTAHTARYCFSICYRVSG